MGQTILCFKKDFMRNKTIGTDNGFQLAKEFLKSIEFYKDLDKYQDGWNDAMHQLLNQPHKGEKNVRKNE